MKNSSQNERNIVEKFLLDSIFEIKINEEERKFGNHSKGEFFMYTSIAW